MKEFAYIHDERHTPSPLRAVPALASFDDDQLDDVLNSSSLLQCEPGDFIIEEGSIDSRIYVLLSGELEVCVGGKKVASINRVGEVFGELALVNQDKRLASVIAVPVAAVGAAVRFRRSATDALALMLVGPPWTVAYVAGVWRGLFIALKRRPGT